MQIQKFECVLKDTIRIKKKELILIVYSFTPSDMIFENGFDAQSDFGKFL